MIRYVRVQNYTGDEVTMPLRYPERSGFLIFNITGIGPEKSELRFTNLATANGGVFNSARMPNRNIVMSLRYWATGAVTVEQIRHESYKYFPIMKPVTLTFQTEERRAVITGYVEANEPVIFSRETHCQISIVCPDPWFYTEDPMITTFDAVNPMFEFPFSNESLTDPLLIMGEIWPETTRSIYYHGDADIGVRIYIWFRGVVTQFSIFGQTADQHMSINDDLLEELTGDGIIEGDEIIISTVKGDKFVTLIRAGVKYNILNALNRDAFWFQLQKGDNVFAYTAESGLLNVSFRIENRVAFEGV